MKPKLILIAGSYKAGTKSLFKYLGAHPLICACREKEPGYFLPKSYGFGNNINYQNDSVDKYRDLFDTNNDHTHIVEATPVYMYSIDAAKAVKAIYPDAHIIFCLRDPIDRLRSWHSMLKHLRLIPGEMTFSDYVMAQMSSAESTHLTLNDFPSRGLKHGLYSKPIQNWLLEFNASQCSFVWFNEIRDNPRSLMNSLCVNLNISPDPYTNYVFKQFNQAVYLKHWWLWSGYLQIESFLRRILGRTITDSAPYRKITRLFVEFYSHLINTPVQHQKLNNNIEQHLISYYKRDVQLLTKIIHLESPWAHRYR